jgi:hypothetical protein
MKPEADPAIGRGRAAALPNAPSREIPSPPSPRDENHPTNPRAWRGGSGAVREAAREGSGEPGRSCGGGCAEGKRRRGGGFGVKEMEAAPRMEVASGGTGDSFPAEKDGPASGGTDSSSLR